MSVKVNALVYRYLIDPLLSSAQGRIVRSLTAGEKVLDVACGTGALSLRMSHRAASVTGIDLDEEMIAYATGRAGLKGMENLQFRVMDATDLSEFADQSFDTALTSMAVHQFHPELAVKVLKEMKRVAGRVIIMDYNWPMQPGLKRLAVKTIEGIAGGDHFRNFKKYCELGGIDYFLREAGLATNETIYSSTVFTIIFSKLHRIN